MRCVRLLAQPFDPASLVARFGEDHPGHGALCSFVGTVRSGGGTQLLELTHYEAMTRPAMDILAGKALARFDLMGLLIVHRIGQMEPGTPIVCIAAAARHRRSAIEAIDYTMDHLKAASWLWKREKREGVWHWIEPRVEDHSDLARWQ